MTDTAPERICRIIHDAICAGVCDASDDVPAQDYVRALAAERDHALAMAAVIEEAAASAGSWENNGDLLLRAGEMTEDELRTAKAVAGGIRRAIESLNPDATAALEREKAKARAEGMREAAVKINNALARLCASAVDIEHAERSLRAILAAIPED